MKRILLLFSIFSFQFSVCNFLSAQNSNQVYRDYIEKYHSMAQEQMKRHSIPASITLAQGLLESAAGQSYLAVTANNHFGIKASQDWTGPYVVKNDDQPNERFRRYKSVEESYEDHSQFLQKPRYQSLFQLSPTDYKGWAQGLKQCGYATSPTYAQQLIMIIENYDLSQYDKTKKKFHLGHHAGKNTDEQSALTEQELASEAFFASHPVQTRNGNYYIVAQQGDDLQSVARGTGVSVRKLRRNNELPKNHQLGAGDILYMQKKRRTADDSMKGIPHVVQPGESLYDIAQRYGVRLKSIYRLNALPADYVPETGQNLWLN